MDLKALAQDQTELKLEPFLDKPFILLNSTSIYDANRTFRMLGLRHMCVVDEQHSIVSFVTRKDLCEAVEEFVCDYRSALKEFAEKLQESVDETGVIVEPGSPIKKEMSDYSLTSEGLPTGAVDYKNRQDIKRARAESDTEAAPNVGSL